MLMINLISKLLMSSLLISNSKEVFCIFVNQNIFFKKKLALGAKWIK
jgi:hypothetical protein